MSFIRLQSGKYLVVDTVPLDDHLKEEIDNMTENGNLMEAVIATHPFHTLAFPAFYEAYPIVPYYGTPRHLNKQPDIPWAGSITENLTKWEPEVYMRIPAGSEFDNPLPENSNHFSSVWVFHPLAKTMHIDDTVMYYKNVSGLVGLVTKIAGMSGTMEFHPSVKGPGLYPTPDAPNDFKRWVEEVINDWDFDTVCTAHLGNKIGGAKELLVQCLENSQSIFDKLIDKNTALWHEHNEEKQCNKTGDDEEDIEKYNVKGSECG